MEDTGFVFPTRFRQKEKAPALYNSVKGRGLSAALIPALPAEQRQTVGCIPSNNGPFHILHHCTAKKNTLPLTETRKRKGVELVILLSY